MEWEKKEELGINKMLDEIENATKMVVNQQLKDIHNQFKSLESMQIIPEAQKDMFSDLMGKMELQLGEMENIIKSKK